jgi:predicted porin
VTLYGRIDLGAAYNSSAANVKGASPKLSMASGQAGASRFGVKGTEDLGGGLKADFLVEAAMASDTGGVTQLGDRNTYVDLNGGFGAVRVGRFLNPQLLQVGKFAAFGTDYAGSGSNIMHVEGARYNNAVSYTTPAIAGFSATVMTAFEESNTFRVAQPLTATATAPSTTAPVFPSSNSGNAVPALKKPVNIGLNYANGPIAVGVAYAENGVSGPKGLTNFGASYDLGVAKIMAQYETNSNITAATGKTAYMLGVTAPVGAGLVRAAYGARKPGIEFAAVSVSLIQPWASAHNHWHFSVTKNLASLVMTTT